MVIKQYYEWDIEEVVTETGDVHDHHHDDLDVLKRFYKGAEAPEELHYRLVLVYNAFSEDHGIVGRAWAYEEDDKMPTHFDNGRPVPQRLIKEYLSIWAGENKKS